MLKPQHLLNRIDKRWLLFLFLLPFVPLVIVGLQKRQPEPRLYLQAAPNNGANPATYATGVAYSPDGQTLACAYAVERHREVVRDQLRLRISTVIRFYDSQSGVSRQTIRLASGEVHHLVFSPDGKTLRADCEDGFTRWWDVNSGRVLRRIWQGKLGLLVFSPDGRWQIAQREPKTSPYNYVILLRDNNKGKIVNSFVVGEHSILAAAFSPDGRQFVLVGSTGSNYDCVARFYRTSDCKLLRTQNWNTDSIFWMKFAGKTQIAGVGGRPFVWRDGSTVQWLEALEGNFRHGSLSTNNRLLAAGGWRIDPPWQSRFTFEYEYDTDPNAWSGQVGVWQLETRKCLWNTRTGGKRVNSIALAPDNSQLAVAVTDTMDYSQRRGHVEVWTLPDSLR